MTPSTAQKSKYTWNFMTCSRRLSFCWCLRKFRRRWEKRPNQKWLRLRSSLMGIDANAVNQRMHFVSKIFSAFHSTFASRGNFAPTAFDSHHKFNRNETLNNQLTVNWINKYSLRARKSCEFFNWSVNWQWIIRCDCISNASSRSFCRVVRVRMQFSNDSNESTKDLKSLTRKKNDEMNGVDWSAQREQKRNGKRKENKKQNETSKKRAKTENEWKHNRTDQRATMRQDWSRHKDRDRSRNRKRRKSEVQFVYIIINHKI